MFTKTPNTTTNAGKNKQKQENRSRVVTPSEVEIRDFSQRM
ncbi:hypothetical protein HMPREF3216_01110, partial [Gardnerella vaginalis]